MNIADLPDDSDTSDEDYVPGSKPEEVVSEVESDGDPEDPLSDSESANKGTKRRKRKHGTKKKMKSEVQPKTEESPQKQEEESEEAKKKRADLLWASFKKDTGFKSKTATNEPANDKLDKPSSNQVENKKVPNKQETVKITKVFQFAGEEVTVEKEVPVDSAEARLSQKPSSSETAKPVANRAKKGLGGIGSVLNQLGKKPKITTLEKSKLDWDRYKREENIEEELSTYNKGKDGYLERQDFLQRADLRRFEIEKEIRTIERNKRMDNVL